jgi:hypothetical protein
MSKERSTIEKKRRNKHGLDRMSSEKVARRAKEEDIN